MAKEKRPNIRGLITRRFYTFFIIILAVFLYLLFSLYKVVVLKGPKFRSEAMATYVKNGRLRLRVAISIRMMEVCFLLLCLNTV